MSNARENPFFSVILPIYNVEPFLEECIHSVLDQEFTDYELILVDDGSTDACPEICDRYAAEYAHIRTVHKENGGLSSARNAGLEVAKGQYIWWVDSDDWVEPDSLKTLYKACEDGRADMVKLNFTRNGEKETIFKICCLHGFILWRIVIFCWTKPFYKPENLVCPLVDIFTGGDFWKSISFVLSPKEKLAVKIFSLIYRLWRV